MIRRFVPAIVAAVVSVALATAVARPVAAAPGWYDGPCLDNVGITVVVDFQEIGDGVYVRCAEGAVNSGLDALVQAGVSWEGTRRFPGFVCRIAGQPTPADEACGNTPPASAYWSYWLAPRGGQWCYSNLGAGNRKPPPGSVEGWSFALNRTASTTPVPRATVPGPIPGETPNPIPGSHCTVPVDTPTTTTPPATTTTTGTTASTAPPSTAAPTTQPTTVTTPATTALAGTTTAPATPTTARVTAPSTTNPSTASTRPQSSAPGPSTTRPPVTSAPTSSASTSSSSTSVSGVTDPDSTDAGQTTIDTAPDASGEGVGASVPADSRPSDTAADSSDTASGDADASVAPGTLDLGNDGRGGSGFGLGAAAGIGAVAAIGTGAALVARRRRGGDAAGGSPS